MGIYSFMEGDSNSEEYLVVDIAGRTDVQLLDSFGVTFFDGSAQGTHTDIL